MVKKTVQDLLTENWYFVQMFASAMDNYGCYRVIVFAKNPEEAKELAVKWANEQGYDVKPIDRGGIYHKNYKRDAKRMVAEGTYIAK